MPAALNEEALLAKKQGGWQRLLYLTRRAADSPTRLSGPELIEFVRLYRAASADLAYFTTHSSNSEVVQYLNALVADAYAVLYVRPGRPFGELLYTILATTARTFRKRLAFVAAGFGLFWGAAAFSFALVSLDRERYEPYFVPPGWEEVVEHWVEGDMMERTADESLLMTGFYASNNPRVAILTMAVGLPTGGLFTLRLLWDNGELLGALSARMAEVGQLGRLYAWVMPHGMTEITGVYFAGGAGLLLGWTLLVPGRRSRAVALKEAGKDAFVIGGTGVLMMFMAAPVEGFFSFNPAIPDAVKIVVACLVGIAWVAFLFGFARGEDADQRVRSSSAPTTAPRSRLDPSRKPAGTVASLPK